MNKEETEEELIEYFEKMCENLNTKKIMFNEWEKYYLKLIEVINNEKLKDYNKYIDALKYSFVYFEDYTDERNYRKSMVKLRNLYKENS